MKTLDLIVIPFLLGFSGCSNLSDDIKGIQKEYKRMLFWDSYSQNDVKVAYKIHALKVGKFDSSFCDYNILGGKCQLPPNKLGGL